MQIGKPIRRIVVLPLEKPNTAPAPTQPQPKQPSEPLPKVPTPA